MIINIHAGHNPDGKKACGAVGLLKESTEARKIKDRVIALLTAEGHTVYDCTVEDGVSQSDVLTKIVQKCNAHSADLDVSIHLNAGRNDYKGDGSTGGVEVWLYNSSSKAMSEAETVCKNISALGFCNRGIKTNSDLYVLRRTAAPAMLVECCFVDDADDVMLYDPDQIANAIADGIKRRSFSPSAPAKAPAPPASIPADQGFLVKILDSALNIRSGPGITHKIAGCIRDHGVYTITEVSGHWGKLKSGAGWISISTKYVKYL